MITIIAKKKFEDGVTIETGSTYDEEKFFEKSNEELGEMVRSMANYCKKEELPFEQDRTED
jgi:hypothetical protein